MPRFGGWPIALSLAVGLAVRIPLLTTLPHSDAAIFAHWTIRLDRYGFARAYLPGDRLPQVAADHSDPPAPTTRRAIDYPPIPVALLAAAVPLLRSVATEGGGPLPMSLTTLADRDDESTTGLLRARAILKLPGLLGDLLIIGMLTGWFTHRFGPRAGAAAGAIVAVHPALIHHSVVWGQNDSLHSAAMLAAVLAIASGRATQGAWWWGGGLLCKLQAIALGPIFLGLALFDDFGRRRRTGSFLRAAAAFAWRPALALAFSLVPFALFAPGSNPAIHHLGSMNRFSRATVQAFNIHWLTIRWRSASFVERPADGKAVERADATAPNPWDPFQTPRDTEVVFAGVSRRALSLGALAAGWLLMAVAVGRRAEPDRILAVGWLSTAWMMAFATQMHERYLLPAAVISLAGITRRPSTWLAPLILGVHAWINPFIVFPGSGSLTTHRLLGPLRAHPVEIGMVLGSVLVALVLWETGRLSWTRSVRMRNSR